MDTKLLTQTPVDLGLTYDEAEREIIRAIAWEVGDGRSETDPNHTRTGLDLSKSYTGGLVSLLIQKGIFTADEFAEASRLAANTELANRMANDPGFELKGGL